MVRPRCEKEASVFIGGETKQKGHGKVCLMYVAVSVSGIYLHRDRKGVDLNASAQINIVGAIRLLEEEDFLVRLELDQTGSLQFCCCENQDGKSEATFERASRPLYSYRRGQQFSILARSWLVTPLTSPLLQSFVSPENEKFQYRRVREAARPLLCCAGPLHGTTEPTRRSEQR